jgi:hypothetical protein
MHAASFLTALVLFSGVVAPAIAQPAKPRPSATNVRSVCQELDASIPNVRKEVDRLSEGMFDPSKVGLSRDEIIGAVNAVESLAVKREESWQRLGCAAIIYGK